MVDLFNDLVAHEQAAERRRAVERVGPVAGVPAPPRSPHPLIGGVGRALISLGRRLDALDGRGGATGSTRTVPPIHAPCLKTPR